MQVDQNSFPAHTRMLRLSSAKVLIRPSQAESTNGKNVIIGEERSEPSNCSQEVPVKKSSELSLNNSKLSWGGGKNKREASGLLRPV